MQYKCAIQKLHYTRIMHILGIHVASAENNIAANTHKLKWFLLEKKPLDYLLFQMFMSGF